MNTLKNVLFFGLLLAVLCGVYLALSRSPDPPLPPGLSADTSPARVEMPNLTGGTISNISSSQQISGPPNFSSQPPPMSIPTADSGGTAPPFKPPVTADRANNTAAQFGGGMAAPPPSPVAPPPTPSPYPVGAQQPPNPGDFSVPPPSDTASLALPPPPGPFGLGQDRTDDAAGRAGCCQGALRQGPGEPQPAVRQSGFVAGPGADGDENSGRAGSQGDLLARALVGKRLPGPEGDTLDIDRRPLPSAGLALAKINGIGDPQTLPPGKPLKVLHGPFSAQISTERSEMTLMLDNRYAGRFHVALSRDLSHAEGMWSGPPETCRPGGSPAYATRPCRGSN